MGLTNREWWCLILDPRSPSLSYVIQIRSVNNVTGSSEFNIGLMNKKAQYKNQLQKVLRLGQASNSDRLMVK